MLTEAEHYKGLMNLYNRDLALFLVASREAFNSCPFDQSDKLIIKLSNGLIEVNKERLLQLKKLQDAVRDELKALEKYVYREEVQ